MNAYVPILVLGALAVGFAVFSVVVAALVGPRRYNRAKLAAYECGIEPLASPDGASGNGNGKHAARPTARLRSGVRAATVLRRGGDRPATIRHRGGARAATIQRFPVKYYLTAMLFIIFDIEIVFLYPWAVHFDALGVYGLAAMALFIFNVSVAYAYEWRRGGLGWD